MKIIKPLLLLTVVAVFFYSCSKPKESPEPGTNTTTGGGPVLIEGGPYPGLWKLIEKKVNGVAVTFNPYTVEMQGGGTCIFTHYDDQNQVDTQFTTSYIVNAGTPTTISFTVAMEDPNRTVKKKYTEQIIWEFGSTTTSEETLQKQ
jgi:hypothetical protein